MTLLELEQDPSIKNDRRKKNSIKEKNFLKKKPRFNSDSSSFLLFRLTDSKKCVKFEKVDFYVFIFLLT